jgi:hypothetical protein
LQAVHELRRASRILKLYATALQPARSRRNYFDLRSRQFFFASSHRAAHFMTVEEHLSTFTEVGFIRAKEICPAADLSLMAAEKP